jgi:hypothetical protein
MGHDSPDDPGTKIIVSEVLYQICPLTQYFGAILGRGSAPMPKTADNIPDAEELAATAAKMLAKRDQKRELDLLLNSEVSIKWFNRDWGIEQYIFYLRLPFELYDQIENEKASYEEVLLSVLNELAFSYSAEIDSVKIIPLPSAEENWRENFTTLSQAAFGFPPRLTQ